MNFQILIKAIKPLVSIDEEETLSTVIDMRGGTLYVDSPGSKFTFDSFADLEKWVSMVTDNLLMFDNEENEND